MKNTFLEDIVESEISKIKKITGGDSIIRDTFHDITKHPILASLGIYFGCDYFFQIVSDYMTKNDFAGIGKYVVYDPADKSFIMASSALAYITFNALRQYYFEGASLKFKNGKNLIDRLYNWTLDNPSIIAACAGLANIPLISVDNIPYHLRRQVSASFILAIPLVMAFTDIGIRNLRNVKRMKRISKNFFTSNLEKVYNTLFEHPILVSSSIGAYQFFQNYNNIYSANKLDAPSWLIVNSLYASLYAGVAFAGLSLAASFLHSHSIRSIKYRTVSLYDKITGNLKNAIENQKKAAKLPDSAERKAENLIILGNLHYKNGSQENAYTYYGKATKLLRKRNDSISYLSYFKQIFYLDRLFRYFSSITNSGIEGAFISLLNKNKNGLEKVKRFTDDNPQDYKMRYLYGNALEILGFSDSAKLQKAKSVSMALKEHSVAYKEKSKRKILLFKDNFLGTEIISKQGNRPDFEEEIKMNLMIKEIINNNDNYEVPDPICITENDFGCFYTMEMAEGDLLKDRLDNGIKDLESMVSAAQFLGLVHAKIDEIILKPERDYLNVLNSRLDKTNLKKDQVDIICNNLVPIVDFLGLMPKVYKKDANSGNWIVTKNKEIVMLDTEPGEKISLTYDTASLICFHDCFSKDEIDIILENHRNSYCENKGIYVDNSEYKLAFYNSIILRAFEMYNRNFIDINSRKNALKNASSAVQILESEFNKEYSKYRKEYTNLEKAAFHLSCILLNHNASIQR
ncbi:hypothetical protein J4440_02425 [Candidatus Woesearchaeota archaeon]|nr:hypothetical protein [Candidatus Woesearchaeota archaeon]